MNILDIWVDAVSREEALRIVQSYLEDGGRPHSIFAANPEKNFSVPKDPDLFKSYREADLLLPDGIGIVVAANWLFGTKLSRLPGSEFIFDICSLARDKRYGIFVYGAKEAVNKRSVDMLKERYPGIHIAGRANGYLKDDEMPMLIEQINASKANILLIALGSPKQEKWFSTYKHHLTHVKVCQGVGGTLDTIGGSVKRAPKLWCKFNLEWLYRLLTEPKRLKRQRVLPVFAWLVFKEWIKLKLGFSQPPKKSVCPNQDEPEPKRSLAKTQRRHV